MSEYYEVYRKRAGHLGLTPQQRALKSGKREFKQFQYYSPFTERELKCRDFTFTGVIMPHKQDELETSMKLMVDTCIDLKTGDLINWNDTNWLVWYKAVSSYTPYNNFEITKCDSFIKWLDDDGITRSSQCHIIGSKEAKLKENFRTWNELITPQPNKFLEIIMPYTDIKKNTEIIIMNEAWRLVEYDKISVPGIIYLSFTEAKVNELTDDIENSLANADRVTVWNIHTADTINGYVGETFSLDYSLSKNGIVQICEDKPEIICGSGLVCDEEGNITILENVESTVIYLSYKDAFKMIQINISEEKNKQGFIEGNDYIRIAQSADYKLILPTTIFDKEFNFSISNDLAEILSSNENSCVIKANRKNKLGKFILSIEYDNIIYEKEIKIISLWQEV